MSREQDGKVEQPTHASVSNNASATPAISGIDTILLTLCTAPGDALPHRHATIRFPSSYQDACAAALKVFAAYLPSEAEAVTLRQVRRREGGQRVWSIISEDDWDVCLQRRDGEVGVFTPDMTPETVPYLKAQPPKKLAYFQYWESYPDKMAYRCRAVKSFETCMAFLHELTRTRGWNKYALYFDERMVRSEPERKLYRDRMDTEDQKPKWILLDDAETFDLLFDLHPEPIWLFVA